LPKVIKIGSRLAKLLQAMRVKNWRILLVQSFTAHMPLLMATSTFGLSLVWFE